MVVILRSRNLKDVVTGDDVQVVMRVIRMVVVIITGDNVCNVYHAGENY